MATRGMPKAGPVTLALGLIGGGLALLLYNLGAVQSLGWMWKLWPVLLIGIGVEYFVKKSLHRDQEVHFHVPSIILIIFLIMIGGAAYATTYVGRNLDRFLDQMPWYHEDQLTYSRCWESGDVPVEAGDRLVLENNVGLINLLPAEEGTDLRVRAVIRSPESGPARELADRVEPQVEQEDGRIIVSVPDTSNGPGLTGRVVTDLTVYVPGGMDLEVHSGTGRVVARDLEANVTQEGNTGSVEFTNVAGKVEVQNNTGRIEIKDPGGDVTAKTNTGSIEMSSERPLNGEYRLTSNTGRVYVQLPGESDLRISAVARTGSISVTGLSDAGMHRDGPRVEYNHTIGDGQGEADLEVGTGSVQITVR